ncbi:hypothetical protein GCM10010168_46540 [Actinoplanes ianthinogenes]|uniref:Uncharacterized protein n=1 Tax=Actinoplanes ianthinogenes TaxID=122358 RepID=A0ABM7LP40_9ACTN|nr:hypothetical protein [Actinoplanes ianthinogenes]BCJ41048.1 hypothetical protein Aiant_17050 [Actinoplanes ianthinogenes]GGR23260.1 hypothetical protein GCM10010168_46540 [Actinoplanes ianthinogenes]
MYDDRITALRTELSRRTGPARYRPLAELGQLLAARAWETGIGTTGAKPDVDAAIEALTEARSWSDPEDVHRARLAAILGSMLAGRVLAYGGPDADRERAVEILEEALDGPAVRGPVDDGCQLFLGLLLMSRATGSLRDSNLLLTAVRTGASLAGTGDLDRAIGLFEPLIARHPADAEIGRMARTSRSAAEAMRDLIGGLGGGAPGFDFGAMIGALRRLQETQQPAAGMRVPMPSFLDAEAMIRGDALDYPVAVVTATPAPATPAPAPAAPAPAAPAPAAPAPAAPAPAAPAPAAPAAPAPAAPAPAPAAPAPAAPAPAAPAAPAPAPAPAAPVVPRQRVSADAVDALRRSARERLVRGAGLWTAVATRLLPGAAPLPADVVDDLAGITTAVLHQGGARAGDHVLAAFARYQRSRLSGSDAGEWDDDPRMAGRHLLDAADLLLTEPADLFSVTCTLADLLDRQFPAGAVRTGLEERLAPALEAVRQAGAQALAIPRPGGFTLVGATTADRVIALGPRPLPGCDGVVSYVPTVATLIDLAQRPRPAERMPVFLSDPSGASSALYEAFYRHPAAADRLVSYLDESSTPEERHGLAILSRPTGTDFPDRADALLAAGLTSVIGWHRPVPPEATAPALFVLHHHLLRQRQSPPVAVHRTREWMRDPARPDIPGLPIRPADRSLRDHADALLARGI